MPELSDRAQDGGGGVSRKFGAKSVRYGDIDRLRFVGALGIVWFHVGAPGAAVGHAALLVFMMLLVYFGVGRPLAERAPTVDALVDLVGDLRRAQDDGRDGEWPSTVK